METEDQIWLMLCEIIFNWGKDSNLRGLMTHALSLLAMTNAYPANALPEQLISIAPFLYSLLGVSF